MVFHNNMNSFSRNFLHRLKGWWSAGNMRSTGFLRVHGCETHMTSCLIMQTEKSAVRSQKCLQNTDINNCSFLLSPTRSVRSAKLVKTPVNQSLFSCADFGFITRGKIRHTQEKKKKDLKEIRPSQREISLWWSKYFNHLKIYFCFHYTAMKNNIWIKKEAGRVPGWLGW